MNQTRYADLVLIGSVQHGEQVPTPNGGKRAKELGHFVAKVPDTIMQGFLQKFKEQCEGKQYIEIAFCDDNPLIKKFVRYNQGGKACHCLEGNTTASQKVNNKWQPIECNEQCQYKQKGTNGKALCNRTGWLRFLIPGISQDKIWLTKITGQTSINRLDAFINLQKAQGTLLENRYILFLRQEEQTNQATGQVFNNYILNIMLEKDFTSANIHNETQKQQDLSTKNTQTVNNTVLDEAKSQTSNANNTNIQESKKIEEPNQKEQTTQTSQKSDTSNTSTSEIKPKKQAKSKTKKTEEKIQKTETPNKQNETDEYSNYYVFESLSSENITTKSGEAKEYSVGNFYDMKDKPHSIIVKPEYAEELKDCELGTIVEFSELKEIGDKTFAMDLKFIQKMQKKIAA